MEKAFEILLAKLKGVDFALISSANLMVQGIAVEPRDIDIVTDNEGVERIAGIFKSQVINEKGFKETEFEIEGFEVHATSLEGNPLRHDDFRKPVWIKKWNLKIPCLPLEADLRFYQSANRPKDAQKIKLLEEKLNERKIKEDV